MSCGNANGFAIMTLLRTPCDAQSLELSPLMQMTGIVGTASRTWRPTSQPFCPLPMRMSVTTARMVALLSPNFLKA